MSRLQSLSTLILFSFFPLLSFSAVPCSLDKLIELSDSKHWELRYSLLAELDEHSDEHKKLLVKLIHDTNNSVANQALVRYIANFLNIDRNLVTSKIEKLNPLPVGALMSSIPDLKSSHFYKTALTKDISDANNAKWISMIGITGKTPDIAIITPYLKSKNPYILSEAAKALHRLGAKNEALKAFRSILNLPFEENFPYQTSTLFLMHEIDSNEALALYKNLHARFKLKTGIQPNWVSAHLLQGMDFKLNVE